MRYLAGEVGIRQFINIGTGIPAQGAVHEITRESMPGANIVYVDNDPVVLAHARALMVRGSDNVAVIEGDMREPGGVLEQVDQAGVIDFTEPVAVLFVAMLHFVTDAEDPVGIIDHFRAHGARQSPGDLPHHRRA